MVLLFVATGMIIYFNDEGMYSYKRLYNETHAPILTVNKMGLLTMERLDLKRFIFVLDLRKSCGLMIQIRKKWLLKRKLNIICSI